MPSVIPRRATTRNLQVFVAALLLATPVQAQRDSAAAAAAFAAGRAAHQARRTDDAVKELERAVQLDPANSRYHMWLGHAYSRQVGSVNFMRKATVGRRAGAAYERAVELDPRSIDAAEARMEFLLEAPGIVGGGVDKARAEAARIASLNKFRGVMALGTIAQHQQQPARAESLYRVAMAQHPDSVWAAEALVALLQTAGRYDDAFQVIDARLARSPDEASSLYNLGRLASIASQRLGPGEAALRRFLAVVGVDSVQQSNAHYRLGVIREKAGDVAVARAEYRTAMSLYAAHPLAAAALKRLDGR
jgi:tetratricopeptide (TPR) repeat protein